MATLARIAAALPSALKYRLQIVRDALAGLGYRVAPGPPVIATPVGSCR
jgi:hypothetical protein